MRSSTLDPSVQAAFTAGWTLAQLHGPILQLPVMPRTALPVVDEMGRSERINLGVDGLESLCSGPLKGALEPRSASTPLGLSLLRVAVESGNDDSIRDALETLHIPILIRLTIADGRLGSAYSLGRCLSDSCWLTTDQASFHDQFSRNRLAKLQGWLSDISSDLSSGAASAVSQSLDHWAAWADVHSDLDWNANGGRVIDALKAQGEHWRALLAGDKDPASLLTPAAYVEAGDKALQRAKSVTWSVIRHYWPVLGCVLLAMALLVALAIAFAGGTAKVWASLVSLAVGFGATGTTITSGASRLGSDAGKPLLNLANADAMGWGCTWLPVVGETKQQIRTLRRRGVAPPSTTRYLEDRQRKDLPPTQLAPIPPPGS